MGEQKCLEIDNFFAKLGHGGGQRVIFRSEQLNLGLQVGQPLLLPLTTLEGGDTASV